MMLLWARCIWVICSVAVSLLPLRRQHVPGAALMFCAPFLLAWIAVDARWIAACLGTIAFVSMFRNPMRYMCAHIMGLQLESKQ